MAGRGKVTPADQEVHPRVLALNKENRWVHAVDPIHFDKPAAGVGLGRTFGIRIADADHDVTVGLIPCAAGGSPISSWEPGGYHSQTKSHPYDDAIVRARVAMESGTLKGILWHQGESDSKAESADGYEERLHELIDRFRDELGANDLPFIAGQMGQFAERPWSESKRTVDAAHRRLPETVSRSAFVSSDLLQHKGDEIHFSADGCRELGRRYAVAYDSLVRADPRESRSAVDSVQTKSDVDRMIALLSNWGRWGKDDQLGALNLITDQKRREAAELVRLGTSVSLAHRLETENAPDNGNPFEHEMLSIGQNSQGPWSMDRYSIAYHGVAHTHMDSLCHLFYDGRMYNGYSRDLVGAHGAQKLSIDNVRTGIFTRGLLIDVPRLRGVRFLQPGSPILPDELESWEKQSGLQVRPGDVVFIRTGRWARRRAHGPWSPGKEGMPGLHASCGVWIRHRDLAMIGSDAALDVIPSGVEEVTHPVHVFTLHAMGVHIFDNCDLEALASKCAELGRYEFLLTASPLIVEGGTGSPLNPIATF